MSTTRSLLDERSALVVHQIARRGLATLVLTVRTGEPITALWKDALLPRLELQPVSRDETMTVLDSGFGAISCRRVPQLNERGRVAQTSSFPAWSRSSWTTTT